jgi:hypothetical protein
VHIRRGDEPCPHAHVFVEPLEGQGTTPFGVQADAVGTSWFVLPEKGRYLFSCDDVWAEVVAHCSPIDALPGYGHIQHAWIVLDQGH